MGKRIVGDEGRWRLIFENSDGWVYSRMKLKAMKLGVVK